MEMQLHPRMLGRICQQLDQNPLWGMLLANEYLSHAEPLHRALRCKAEQVLNTLKCRPEAALLKQQILSGAKLALLPEGSANTLVQPCRFKAKRAFDFEPIGIAQRRECRSTGARKRSC